MGPSEQTGSGCWFDRSPGVLILELHRTEITECRVKPSTVVNLLKEARKVFGNVDEGFECHRINGFDLECLHEALRRGVVVWVAAPAHGADQAVGGKMIAIGSRSVLGGFKRSSQHQLFSLITAIRQAPPPAFSIPASFSVGR